MNIQKAIHVIDKISAQRQASSCSITREDRMRVKLSDLRDVILALAEPAECEHSYSEVYGDKVIGYRCLKCNYEKPIDKSPDPLKHIREVYEKYNETWYKKIERAEYVRDMWEAISKTIEQEER